MLDPSLQLDCLTPTIPCPQTFFSSLSLLFFLPQIPSQASRGKWKIPVHYYAKQTALSLFQPPQAWLNLRTWPCIFK